MRTILLIACLLALSSCCHTERPLCRHIVLSQYAAFKDAGYDAEIWHMSNLDPKAAGGFKYHVAVRVRKNSNEPWQWVAQPQTSYHTTPNQPTNTKLRKRLSPERVLSWVPNTGVSE
jgi:hypothetical protein